MLVSASVLGEKKTNGHTQLNEFSITEPNCFLSPAAGDAIAQLTDVGSAAPPPSDGRVTVFSDRTGMVKAARLLLSSVTKVLVLADRIVIKQIITSRNKVRRAGVRRPPRLKPYA